MLTLQDLDFEYPPESIALKAKPRGESRILKIPRHTTNFEELTWPRFLGHFKTGDVLVLNNTEVLWARLFVEKESGKEGEVFFLKTLDQPNKWEVLTRGLNLKPGKTIKLPGGIKARVIKAGRTSELEILDPVDLKKYFAKHGHVPLPPYIDRKDEKDDRKRYQNVWAQVWGSVAAPTAGLHFSEEHLEELMANGVKIAYVTLHVGAGTFLPIETEKLDEFKIHSEVCEVKRETCEVILKAQAAGKTIWACGTTVARALETAVLASPTGGARVPLIAPFLGETKLFIQPGFDFKVVRGLLTNFHQPRSSLIALAAAFAVADIPHSPAQKRDAIEKLKSAYRFAIEKDFRLFSYGDLTVMV